MQTPRTKFRMHKWSWKRLYRREKLIANISKSEYTVWVHGLKAYRFFRKTRPKIKKQGKVTSKIYAEVVKSFYKKVAQYVVECTDGVHIQGLGYFGAMIYNDKCVSSFPYFSQDFQVNMPIINENTDGKIYCLCFVHDKFKPIARTFIPDYTFHNDVKKSFYWSLTRGKKYRFHASLFI